MGLWSALGAGIGSIFGPAGTAIGGGLGEYADGKVNGVPTPDAPDGRDTRNYMDEAFPGTTAWERLGSAASGATGAAVSSNSAAKLQTRLQSQELKTRENIAENTNRASIISSAIPSGPRAVAYGLGSYLNLPGDDYDTKTQQERERLEAEKPGILARNRSDEARAEYSDQRERGEAYSINRLPGTIMGVLDFLRPKDGPKIRVKNFRKDQPVFGRT